jgi:hypothetical protein
MLSQHHINDCINISLAIKLEHIVKMLWKHKYMGGASFVIMGWINFIHYKSKWVMMNFIGKNVDDVEWKVDDVKKKFPWIIN